MNHILPCQSTKHQFAPSSHSHLLVVIGSKELGLFELRGLDGVLCLVSGKIS